MDKVKLDIKAGPTQTIHYSGLEISVLPFLDFETQVVLTQNYLQDYFGTIDEILIDTTTFHYFEAECRLMNYVVQLTTNIDIESAKNNFYVENELWEKITSHISNWKLFRDRLDKTVEEVWKEKTLNASLGPSLTNIFEKLEDFLGKIENISPEDIQKLQDTGTQLVERLEKSSVLRNPNDISMIVAGTPDMTNAEKEMEAIKEEVEKNVGEAEKNSA